MNVSREDVIVSALSSILTEKIAEVEDFSDVEIFGVRETHRLLCKALERSFSAFDEMIFEERDTRFKSKGFEKRTLLTSVGPVLLKRRRYSSDRGDVYLLDEALSIPSHSKVSPQLLHLAGIFSLDSSYRGASRALKYYLGDSLSPPSIARMLKVNERLLDEVEQTSEKSKISAPVIDVEADGCFVYLQRSSAQKQKDHKRGIRHKRVGKEVGVFSAYAGKEKRGKHKKVRKGILHYASVAPAKISWEEFCARIDKHFDAGEIFYTNLACDGDKKYLKGASYLPGKVSVGYDLHHIPSKIAQVLGVDIAKEVYGTIKGLGFSVGLDILETYAWDFYADTQDRKYIDLLYFFYEHRDSMETALKYNLGTIEGTNAHIIGARCKNFGGGWGSGLEPMVRLRAASACGIRPKLATRKSNISLPEIAKQRTLIEIEGYIAGLEKRAKQDKPKIDPCKGEDPLYYHQGVIAHRSKSEACYSFLRKWA